MPTIPDDHQPHHDHAQLAVLRVQYPEWTIERSPALPVFTAELAGHGGRSLHYLVGHTVGELAGRLGAARTAER